MKVSKAIKLIEFLFVRRPKLIDADYDAAIKLGCEALKRERKHREGLILTKPELLPGETPEENEEERR